MMIGDRKRILIVDDDPALLEPLLDAFDSRGFHVESAKDGIEALMLLDRADASFDLLLADVDMPRMDGKDLAGVIHAHHPKIKIMLMSGKTDEIVVPLGATGRHVLCMRKPFTPASLIAAVLEELSAPGP